MILNENKNLEFKTEWTQTSFGKHESTMEHVVNSKLCTIALPPPPPIKPVNYTFHF